MNAWRSLDQTTRRGVTAILVAFFVLGLGNTWTVRPFRPRDESSHMSYVLRVIRGELPRMDDRNVPGVLPNLKADLPTWVANHPPLYYALAAGPVELAIKTGHPVLAVRLARMVNLVFGALTVVLAAILASLVVPGRRAVPIIAAAVTAFTPLVAHNTGLAFNDGLGMAGSTALLVAGMAIFRGGVTRGRIAFLAGAAAFAALARFSSLFAIPPAMFLAAIGAWRTGGDRRVRDAAVAIATPAIAALVAGGWFYARNYSIYGSITGNGFIKPPLGAKPKRPFLDVATDIEFWRPLSRHIWDAFQGVRTLTPWNAWIGYAIEAPVLVGLGLLLCRRVRTGTRVERSNLAVWLALGGFAAVVVASLISFVAIGGNPHARYLFPALPIFGIAIALGYLALPRVFVTGAFVATAVVNVALLHRYVANNTGVRHKQIVSAEIEALRNAGLPGVRPLLVVAALVFAALVAIATIALWRAAGGDAQALLAARSSGETGEEPEHGGVEGVGQLP